MFSVCYNEAILNSTKNSKTSRERRAVKYLSILRTKTTKFVLQKMLSFWKKRKNVFMNVELEKHLLKVSFFSTEVFVKLRFFFKKCHEIQTAEANKQNCRFVKFSSKKILWENIINWFSSFIIRLGKRTLFKDFLFPFFDICNLK